MRELRPATNSICGRLSVPRFHDGSAICASLMYCAPASCQRLSHSSGSALNACTPDAVWSAGPATRHLDSKGYEVTTGIGPDLMAGARMAVSEMVDLLSRRYGYSPIDAYMLCSVCADLRISSIVDVPNWVVSFYFPRVVLE